MGLFCNQARSPDGLHLEIYLWPLYSKPAEQRGLLTNLGVVGVLSVLEINSTKGIRRAFHRVFFNRPLFIFIILGSGEGPVVTYPMMVLNQSATVASKSRKTNFRPQRDPLRLHFPRVTYRCCNSKACIGSVYCRSTFTVPGTWDGGRITGSRPV